MRGRTGACVATCPSELLACVPFCQQPERTEEAKPANKFSGTMPRQICRRPRRWEECSNCADGPMDRSKALDADDSARLGVTGLAWRAPRSGCIALALFLAEYWRYKGTVAGSQSHRNIDSTRKRATAGRACMQSQPLDSTRETRRRMRFPACAAAAPWAAAQQHQGMRRPLSLPRGR